MGRARLPMEPIQEDKTRKITFQKRKKGLLKKAYEFSTLCDVDACLIIYPDNADQPEIWPEDPGKVSQVLEKYGTKITEKRPKNYDVREFFNDRRNKVEAELAKVRKEIKNVMYPTWDDSFNSLGHEQLRNFITTLDTKLEACNQRIKMLKRRQFLMQKEVESEAEAADTRFYNFLQNKSQVPHCYAPMNQLGDNISNQLPLNTLQFDMVAFDPNLIQFMEKNNEKVHQIDQAGVSMPGREIVTSTAMNGAPHYYPKSHVPKHDEDGDNQNLLRSYYNGGKQPIHPPYIQYPPWQSFPVQSYEAALQTFPVPVHAFQLNGCGDLPQANEFNYMNAKK